jgi:hypothetical protein
MVLPTNSHSPFALFFSAAPRACTECKLARWMRLAKVWFALQGCCPTKSAGIGKGRKPGSHRHLRLGGDSGPGSQHRQDGRELTALKDPIGFEPRVRKPLECFRESSALPGAKRMDRFRRSVPSGLLPDLCARGWKTEAKCSRPFRPPPVQHLVMSGADNPLGNAPFPDLREDSGMPEPWSDHMPHLFRPHARLRLGASSMKRGTEDGRSHR